MKDTNDLLPGMTETLEASMTLEQETLAALPSCEVQCRMNIPEIVSKELQFANFSGGRKIRLSSNFLPLFGFQPGVRHDVVQLDDAKGGIRVCFNNAGRQKIYSRSYPSRRNNPTEAVLEIGSQAIINAAFPNYVERVHITMRSGEITVRPLPNRTFHIRKAHRESDGEFAASVAMTGGIDAHCLANAGFKIDSILEYRPQEARDNKNLTETGAINVLANCTPRVLINEDISTVDWNNVRDALAGGPRTTLIHISLQCDDFSQVKGANLRAKAIVDGSSSRDLAYDALRMVETLEPAAVMLENVPSFADSPEGILFKLKLRKWGYNVTEAILRGDRFGGLTRRERYYLVASVFPSFEFPHPGDERTSPIWPNIERFLPSCRDISHTSSLKKGIESGRSRIIDENTIVSPTLLKSQNRQAKDSVYIKLRDGRYVFPSLALQKRLNGIPDEVHLDNVSSDIASEIIGQSIEYPMHHAIAVSLSNHLLENRRNLA